MATLAAAAMTTIMRTRPLPDRASSNPPVAVNAPGNNCTAACPPRKRLGSVPRLLSRARGPRVKPCCAWLAAAPSLSRRGTGPERTIAAGVMRGDMRACRPADPLGGWRGSRRPRSKILLVGRLAAWASGGPSSRLARLKKRAASAALRSLVLDHPPDGLRSRLVRTAGFEPARPYGQKILSLQRLPVPPRPHGRL